MGLLLERSTFLHHLQSQKFSPCLLVWVSQFRCVFISDVITVPPQVLSTPEAHTVGSSLSPPSAPPTQTTTLTLPVTHPGEVSFAARILYLDFHSMHNKYERITSPLCLYFNFMESNQGEKQHDNQATKLSADCNSGQHRVSRSFTDMVVMVLSQEHGSKTTVER